MLFAKNKILAKIFEFTEHLFVYRICNSIYGHFFLFFFLKTKSVLPSFTYLQNAEADTPSAKDKLCFVGTKPMLYLEEEKVYSAVPL